MDWTPKSRSACVAGHIKHWCAEVLEDDPDAIALRSGRSRHRNRRSLFIVPVARTGRPIRKIALEVGFSPNNSAPRFSAARTPPPVNGTSGIPSLQERRRTPPTLRPRQPPFPAERPPFC